MGIIDTIRNAIAPRTQGITTPADTFGSSDSGDWFGSFSTLTHNYLDYNKYEPARRRNEASLYRAWQLNPTVTACIRETSEAIISLMSDVHVERFIGGDWQVVDNHPAARLVNDPLRDLVGGRGLIGNAATLWQTIVQQDMTLPDSFYYFSVNAQGAPVRIAPVPYLNSQAERRNGMMVYKVRVVDADGRIERKDVDPMYMWHLRGAILNAAQDWQFGVNPLTSIATDMMVEGLSGDAALAVLANMGIIGLLLMPREGNILPNEANAIKRSIDSLFTGRGKGRTAVFQKPMDADNMQVDVEKLFDEVARAYSQTNICSVLGVPPVLIQAKSGLDKATYANYQEARVSFYQTTVQQRANRYARELSARLLPMFQEDLSKTRITYNADNIPVLASAQNDLSRRHVLEWMRGLITRAEYRSFMGLPTEQSDDVYYDEYRQMYPSFAMPSPRAVSEPGSQRILDMPRVVPNNAPATDIEYNELIRESSARLAEDFRHQMAQALSDWDDAIVTEVEALYDDGIEVGELVTRSIQASDSEYYKAMIRNGYRSVFLASAEAVVDGANVAYGMGLNLPDEVARTIIGEGGTRMGLLDLDDSARNNLYDMLREGRSEGEGVEALMRRIRGQVTSGRFKDSGNRKGINTRARLIARTETAYAQNRSTILVYEGAEGVSGLRIWDAQMGETDEECMARNGDIVTFAEAKALEEHPNGTLSFTPVFDS